MLEPSSVVVVVVIVVAADFLAILEGQKLSIKDMVSFSSKVMS
jgi:hypothetical protein